ncbi:MAG: succinylglutamate desuccinylase/aspartoacylase family protein [Bacteriovoracaceae bacterium]
MKKKIKEIDPKVLVIGKEKVLRGQRKKVLVESAALYDYTKLNIPIEVVRGNSKGPVLFISAAIHGDEINGTEIIRRILKRVKIKNLCGTLIAIPVVNVFGFNNKSRYLPDRRDLNRSFPGNSKGSLAGRLAKIFMTEVVSNCSHGIDLHTGSIHRTNLPQIRACLDDENTKILAEGFGVPVIINSKLRDGSLREAARKKNVSMLLFEGGQALRFEENIIRVGLRGCFSVMKSIGMIKSKPSFKKKPEENKIFTAKSSHWVRAPRSGAFNTKKRIGDLIKIGDVLATISDPFGQEETVIYAEHEGILIGSSLLPLVNQGDGMFHIATFDDYSEHLTNAIEELEITN